ncbi:hypothetical protein BCR34DRAFT_303714 [Clohesyomyces aquaticus]|uniref:Uncharacterized protein n=1 Tax=Clohesyomyces aquaticus TaxID=1231657 RepID=A0A1Y1ZQ30_9PLEO|nr:hypothetical protein BCR34DRAFT_303714 [Clohesyomyces aquaticus]
MTRRGRAWVALHKCISYRFKDISLGRRFCRREEVGQDSVLVGFIHLSCLFLGGLSYSAYGRSHPRSALGRAAGALGVRPRFGELFYVQPFFSRACIPLLCLLFASCMRLRHPAF